MSGGGSNKKATRFWHQGFIIGKDAQGRDCLRFQTESTALNVSEDARRSGYRLHPYEDGGDWCLRLLAKGESP